jgi:hypothetical protein
LGTTGAFFLFFFRLFASRLELVSGDWLTLSLLEFEGVASVSVSVIGRLVAPMFSDMAGHGICVFLRDEKVTGWRKPQPNHSA